MRLSKSLLAKLSIGLVAVAGVAVADESAKSSSTAAHGTPVPQKVIQKPFLDQLVGSWLVESTSTHDGKEGKGAGKSSFERGIGGTAILETYESTGAGPDGKPMTLHGHGVFKVSDDGETLTGWWFCNMSPEPMKLTGPITDMGFDISGDGPNGKIVIQLQKSPDGLSLRGTEGGNEMMKESYTRAR